MSPAEEKSLELLSIIHSPSSSLKEKKMAEKKYYDTMFDVLYKFIYYKKPNSVVTEDVVIETISNSIIKFHQYDSSRCFMTWIHQMAKNKLIDVIRAKRVRVKTIPLEQKVLPYVDKEHEVITEKKIAALEIAVNTENYSPTESMEREERRKLVNRMIHSIKNDSYKEVCIMFYKEEMSLEEISEELDMNLSTVKISLFRARKAIKEQFDDVMYQY